MRTGRSAGRQIGDLALYGPSTYRPVATQTERVVPSRDGRQALYLKQRELRLWDPDEGDLLLTRFTDAPTQLAVVPGGTYALFGSGLAIDAIADDGSNTTELSADATLLEVINRETLLVRDANGSLLNLDILKR